MRRGVEAEVDAGAGAGGAAAEETVDAFLRGGFRLVQPRRGHRSGLDALLLAAAVPRDARGRLLDLGAGSGAVAFAALTRAPDLHATLVEIDPAAADRARRGAALNAHLGTRVDVVEGDVLSASPGASSGGFDHVVANPPFNVTGRVSPNGDRARAHAAVDLAAWIGAMRRAARPGGRLALIVRPSELPLVLAEIARGAGGVSVTPVHPRAGEPAHRVVVAAAKGARAPLTLAPPLVVHEGGGFTREAAALFE